MYLFTELCIMHAFYYTILSMIQEAIIKYVWHKCVRTDQLWYFTSIEITKSYILL